MWDPFPLNILEEDQASINRTSHHRRRQLILDWIHSIDRSRHTQVHQAQEHLSSGGCSSLVTIYPRPKRQSTTPHWSRVLHHICGPYKYKLLRPSFFGFVELGLAIWRERSREGEIFVRTPVFEPQGFCRNPKSDTPHRKQLIELNCMPFIAHATKT